MTGGQQTDDEWAVKPSLRVVEAVSEAEDVSPANLRLPLHTVVDPAALDRLFMTPTQKETGAETDRLACVSFPYCGYTVTVRADGQITLE